MNFRIGRDRNVERRNRLQAANQLNCVAIACGMRSILGAGSGESPRSATILRTPRVPIIPGDSVDLILACTDAGQMRGGGERGFPKNPLDRVVGPLAGRDRRRHRLRRRSAAPGARASDRAPQRLSHGLGLGRKKLEADLDVTARFREQRQVMAEAFERVHAARLCGIAALIPRHRVTVSSPPSRC